MGVHNQYWKSLLAEYRKRVAIARAMGGDAKLKERRKQGRMNAREVLHCLCDRDSFSEIGTLVGALSYHGERPAPADALVGGYATVNKQPVVVCAEDFTVMGGSIGPGTNAKKLRLATIAYQERVPFIMFLDGAGERVSNTLHRRSYAPNDMQVLANLSSRVPSVAIVYGVSAGHGAISGLLLDFIVMLDDSSLFTAGPPLVEAASGEKISKEDLGGAPMHARTSGVAHNRVVDIESACELTRRYLSYMPAHGGLHPPRKDPQLPECGHRKVPELMEIIPEKAQQPYDMHDLVRILSDTAEDWLEFQPEYGGSLLTGFVRIGGVSCALLANQPLVQAGAITVEAARKASYFLGLCHNFNLPVLFLADTPGVMSGGQAERAGTLRAAADMYKAVARLKNVPKFHVTVRKAFGFGSSLMAMNPFDDQTLSLALPGIHLAAMPATGASKISGDDQKTRDSILGHERNSAWMTGDNLAHDEIIEPAELRNRLIDALQWFRRDHAL